MLDLFGEPVEDRVPSGTRPRGHAAPPGTGPKGETCGTCGNVARKIMSTSYFKCALMKHAWTNGRGTDVLSRDPACRMWAARNEDDR